MNADYVIPGNENMTPNQIRELQEQLNKIVEELGLKNKIIVLPPGSKVDRALRPLGLFGD